MFTLSNYKDVDNVVSSIVSEFYVLIDDNKYDEAYSLLAKNKALIEPYYINANSFNKIELGIWEIAQRLFNSQKIIVSGTEPDTLSLNVGSEWIKPVCRKEI